MLTALELKDFKSFQDATVPFAAFSLLVGANASGKSNIREALRFLHGLSRGYSLAEILGEKWAEGGVRVWNGVRGGARQAPRHGCTEFTIAASFRTAEQRSAAEGRGRRYNFTYRITVSVSGEGIPSVVGESLHDSGDYVYDTHPEGVARGTAGGFSIKARVRKFGRGQPPDGTFLQDRPILTQIDDNEVATDATRRVARAARRFLESMTFLDLDPDSARRSSPKGVSVLGDRGKNLSSVLAAICSEPHQRELLTSWIRAFTPMDAVDIRFQEDLNNRVLAILVEADDSKTPLTSASDGTVRFLAMIASLLNPARPSVIFFEEIENGVHPNRVALLLDLIEQSVHDGRSQVIATSHSPQLLVHALRSEDSLPALITRIDGAGSVAVDVAHHPAFADILQREDPAGLMAAGWLEDIASFEFDPAEPVT